MPAATTARACGSAPRGKWRSSSANLERPATSGPNARADAEPTMQGLTLVAVGAAFLAAGGLIALRRAPVERARSGQVTVPTVIAAYVAYLGPSVCLVLASWWSPWPLPPPRGLAYPLGGALLVAGLVGYIAARREFRSLRRNWGMRTDRLVTTGPYAYSRNPQLMGWALVLLGAAIAGRSGAALALAAIYWVG